MGYEPPFSITPLILQQVGEIVEHVTPFSVPENTSLTPQLRRNNRIRTIQASLAIESNTLSIEQVTAVLDGKPVLGLPHEIQEVRNAYATYERLSRWKPQSAQDLLAAHSLLMAGLVDDAGHYRSGHAGIYSRKGLIHMAPPAKRLPELMSNLLGWIASVQLHPLIASCAFHYEFQFIHPFADGNGRIGRLWQTLILSRWQPMLAYLPVESLIKIRQANYYKALEASYKLAASTPFIEFMLQTLLDSLKEMRSQASEKIIAALGRNRSITISDLAGFIGVTSRSIERNLQKPQSEGRLCDVPAPRKAGSGKFLNSH